MTRDEIVRIFISFSQSNVITMSSSELGSVFSIAKSLYVSSKAEKCGTLHVFDVVFGSNFYTLHEEESAQSPLVVTIHVNVSKSLLLSNELFFTLISFLCVFSFSYVH